MIRNVGTISIRSDRRPKWRAAHVEEISDRVVLRIDHRDGVVRLIGDIGAGLAPHRNRKQTDPEKTDCTCKLGRF